MKLRSISLLYFTYLQPTVRYNPALPQHTRIYLPTEVGVMGHPKEKKNKLQKKKNQIIHFKILK